MQVNSAQDYLTRYKRRVIASTVYSTPPEQKNKTNGVYLATVANNATVRQVLHVPTPSGWGDAPGGITVTSWCVGCEAAPGAPGTFQVINTKGVLTRQALRPIGIRATVSQQ
jgi:hypothetical protein